MASKIEPFNSDYYLYSTSGQGFKAQGGVWSMDTNVAVIYTLSEALDLSRRATTALGNMDRFPVAVIHIESIQNADR